MLDITSLQAYRPGNSLINKPSKIQASFAAFHSNIPRTHYDLPSWTLWLSEVLGSSRRHYMGLVRFGTYHPVCIGVDLVQCQHVGAILKSSFTCSTKGVYPVQTVDTGVWLGKIILPGWYIKACLTYIDKTLEDYLLGHTEKMTRSVAESTYQYFHPSHTDREVLFCLCGCPIHPHCCHASYTSTQMNKYAFCPCLIYKLIFSQRNFTCSEPIHTTTCHFTMASQSWQWQSLLPLSDIFGGNRDPV